MGKPPVLKPHEVAAILKKLGFVQARQRGPHRQYCRPDVRSATIPFHRGRDISPILLRQIAKDVGLSLEQLLEHR